jgi:glutamate 5-kinase
MIPIINENDAISNDEIGYGDNDRLSADVAVLAEAELLILLSDINGLYSCDPKKNPDAIIIPCVYEITPEINSLA